MLTPQPTFSLGAPESTAPTAPSPSLSHAMLEGLTSSPAAPFSLGHIPDTIETPRLVLHGDRGLLSLYSPEE